MKKVLFILCVIPVFCFAGKLRSFHAIKKHLRFGDDVHVYMNFARCKPRMGFSSVYNPRAVMLFKNHISFSDQHLTLNNPHFEGRAIIENVHYQLDHRGYFSVKTTLLDAKTYEQVGHQPPAVACRLNDSVWFYDD